MRYFSKITTYLFLTLLVISIWLKNMINKAHITSPSISFLARKGKRTKRNQKAKRKSEKEVEKRKYLFQSKRSSHEVHTRVHLARIILPRKLASLVRLYRLFRSAYLSREPWLFCLQHLAPFLPVFLSFILLLSTSPATSLCLFISPVRSHDFSLLSLSRRISPLSRSHRVAPVFYRGWFPGHGFGQDLLLHSWVFTRGHATDRRWCVRVAVRRLALSMHF